MLDTKTHVLSYDKGHLQASYVFNCRDKRETRVQNETVLFNTPVNTLSRGQIGIRSLNLNDFLFQDL